jgi:uncharacterized protein (TIGR02757 family)
LSAELKTYLDSLVARFEVREFLDHDPIAIPHGFDDPRDQEVIGLYAALLAWGQRTTILNKMADLCERMEYRPFRFVYDFATSGQTQPLANFKHRTFQPTDALWFTNNLSRLLREHGSVERLFSRHLPDDANDLSPAIEGFSTSMMTADVSTPQRLQKHLARPSTGSACKRIVMYLRWMVRGGPVDFGIWRSIRPDQLMLPLDVHSGRQARALGLVTRNANDWRAAVELTDACRNLDPQDPARYDFAFFGAGAYGVELDRRFVVASTDGDLISPTE